MNCPSCGSHVPAQRRMYPRRKVDGDSRLYKRVWTRAKRRGVTLEVYMRTAMSRWRQGLSCDRDAVDLLNLRRVAS